MGEMNYATYKVEDFVLDRQFRHWVLSGDSAANVFWDKFLKDYPHQADTVAAARSIVLSLSNESFVLSSSDKDALWGRISSGVHEQGVEQDNVIPISAHAVIEKSGSVSRRMSTRKWLRIAASVSVFLFSASLLFIYLNRSGENTSFVVHSSKPGTKAEVLLPDGSTVILNAASSIRYKEGLRGSTRKIQLNGEAFFEVKKDALRPFVVEAGGLATTALGTSFNVLAYEETNPMVSLITGKVSVKTVAGPGPLHETVLLPGESASLIGGDLKKDQVMLGDAIAWTKGVLRFENASMKDAFKSIERWYGVKIDAQNLPDENVTISGSYTNETLGNVLEGMSFSARFDFKVNGSNVTITFRQPAPVNGQ